MSLMHNLRFSDFLKAEQTLEIWQRNLEFILVTHLY